MVITGGPFSFLFCCLAEEQVEEIKKSIDEEPFLTAQRFQQHLLRDKNGYRCEICGRLYPFLRIEHQNQTINPKSLSRLKGKKIRCKKAADVFSEKRYYAQQKKTLMKFEFDADGNACQTDAVPIMGEVYHIRISPDDRFGATETFKGTIAIVDLIAKQTIARRTKCSVNGSFLFNEENELLYFLNDAIRRWNFLNNREEIIWEAPEEWKSGGRVISCQNVISNDADGTYLFQVLVGAKDTHIVAVKDHQVVNIVPISEPYIKSRLVYIKEREQYTLCVGENACVYDADFRLVDEFPCPELISLQDGGGQFTINQFAEQYPRRVFLSPDGKWVLLDYFTEVILMKREDLSLKFCLFSEKGGVSLHMGFLDDHRFWYTWGDTTYIQEIKE